MITDNVYNFLMGLSIMEIVNEEKTIKCCYCNTLLKYTAKDIRTTFFVKKPYIECPVCGAKLFMI